MKHNKIYLYTRNWLKKVNRSLCRRFSNSQEFMDMKKDIRQLDGQLLFITTKLLYERGGKTRSLVKAAVLLLLLLLLLLPCVKCND